MKRINVAGIKLDQLVARGKLPANMTWHGDLPQSYSLHFVTNGRETLVVASDGWSGQIAWSRVDGEVNVIGKEMAIDSNERDYLARHVPSLLEAIDSL